MIKQILKKIYRYTKYIIKEISINKNSLKIDWHGGLNNFGDILNPILVEKLSKKSITQVNSSLYYNNHFFIIGSILDRATKFTTVWGTGFISEDSFCKEKPKKIYAVRGPKTRELLLRQGIFCPEVYGDPALLLPQVYAPNIKKLYKLGIIPHYVDKSNGWLDFILNNKDILIIDIQTQNPLEFIDLLLSCDRIASSSLHGVIVADAYNIPSIWIEFSKDVTGNGFKFYDYFLSVGRVVERPFKITDKTTLPELFNQFIEYKIDIDLDALINAAPFDINIKSTQNTLFKNEI